MAFQISPGINITEIDRTGVINQIVSTTTAAYVGNYKWGAVNEITLITSENQLVAQFGGPDDTNFVDFFSAANFVGYGAPLQLIRAGDSSCKVANAGGNGFVASNIWNQAEWEALTNYGLSAAAGITGVLCARYPGIFGNSLKISYSDNVLKSLEWGSGISTGAGEDMELSWDGSVGTITSNATAGNGDGFTAAEFAVGDLIKFQDRRYQWPVTAVDATSVSFTVSGSTSAAEAVIVGKTTATAVWAYERFLSYLPTTSEKAASLGYSNDEVAIAVIDEDGLFGGQPGQVLETFIGCKAKNGTLKDGGNFYYPLILDSNYIRWVSHPESDDLDAVGTHRAWGSTFSALGAVAAGHSASFKVLNANKYISLNGGTDPVPATSNIQEGYAIFEDAENTESNLLIQGGHDYTIGQYLVDLAETRKDAIVFVGAELSDVNNVSGSEAVENLITWKDSTLNRESSYAVMDSGWKYQYDKYSDTYRWVPLNPDIAGLCARTDAAANPWYSPAGYNRGQIRNVVKLAFNPSKPLRDILYTNGINPVITTAGSGTILFGDKTLTTKPSAFNRINVRRLFVALEKAVSTAAKFQLFEFNDEFTRANFIGLVEPFLREAQATNGVAEFKIICDESNNTPEVIENNEFVADIYIKPLQTINYVQLNFIATRQSANFSEIGAAVNI